MHAEPDTLCARKSLDIHVVEISSFACHHKHASHVKIDFCMFGERWRKRTKLVGTLPGLQTVEAICRGRGLCAKTGLAHFKLEGRDESGTFYTKRAEPYPYKLCHELAMLIKETFSKTSS